MANRKTIYLFLTYLLLVLVSRLLVGCGSTSGSSAHHELFVYISTDGGSSFSSAYPGIILNTTIEGAVDPCAVRLDDNRIRMYYFGSYSTGGDPVTTQPDGVNRFYVAESIDGLTFTQEAQVITGETISDPFVLRLADSSYVMYISRGSSVLSARSADGVDFTWDTGGRGSGGRPQSDPNRDGRIFDVLQSGECQ
jgi:hypothetical protein